MAKRTLISCTKPQWANADHTIIVCEAQFKEVSGVHPFAAGANDPEEHGRALFAALMAGKYGSIGEYTAPPPAPARVVLSPPAPTAKKPDSTDKPTTNVKEL